MDSDQGKLFIGGISWETTEEKLAEYFRAYGDVAETVIMRDRATGRPRGFGFVAFSDPSIADRVLLESHTIDGRTVEAKKAMAREEQQQHSFSRSNRSYNINSGGGAGDHIRTKKIFVGGLAPSVTECDFRGYFEQFGNIIDVVVMYDHNTQRPRGFGFITFDSEDAVDRVLQKPFHEIGEKAVEVKRAIPKELSAGNSGRSSGGGPPFGGFSQGYRSNRSGGYGPQAPAPAGRGSYPSYAPGGGYASGGYGSRPEFAPPMNGNYGASGYPGGSTYDMTSAGYGGTAGGGQPIATGHGAGPRSPWGGSASPGSYGTGTATGYGASAGGGMPSGYGATGWVSGTPTQPSAMSSGYGNAAPAYGAGNSGYAPANAPGYGPSGGVQAGPTSYGDGYTGSAYGDMSWRPGTNASHTFPVPGPTPAAHVAYGMGSGAPVTSPTNGSANYTGGFGVAGRQMQRGSDARFRPYPSANERTA